MSSVFSGSTFVQRGRMDEARDGGIAFTTTVTRKDVDESRAEAHDRAVRGEA